MTLEMVASVVALALVVAAVGGWLSARNARSLAQVRLDLVQARRDLAVLEAAGHERDERLKMLRDELRDVRASLAHASTRPGLSDGPEQVPPPPPLPRARTGNLDDLRERLRASQQEPDDDPTA